MNGAFGLLEWIYVYRRYNCFMCMKESTKYKNTCCKQNRDDWYDDIGYCLDRPEREWPHFDATEFMT